MTEATQDIAHSLLAENFDRKSPDAKTLSEPLADTPMVLTLDQLRPYELNPRVTRNPLYDDIKSSIVSRGLDAPPAVTRRPGQEHYIIRNGGNTRLKILQELWSETKEERFFHICCLYRPWQNEITALTGHLAENELHGSLTFIERALGVQKARELYEEETGKSLSQSELAKRLSQDGFPCDQSQISRMSEAVDSLLPAIPVAMYGGMHSKQIRKLLSLRQSALRFWINHTRGKNNVEDFVELFQDVLAQFDAEPRDFDFTRMQDELIGQIANLVGCGYELVLLDIQIDKTRQTALTKPPMDDANIGLEELLKPKTTEPQIPTDFIKPDLSDVMAQAESVASRFVMRPHAEVKQDTAPPQSPRNAASNVLDEEEDAQARMQAHIVSPANISERVQSIQKMVAEHTGDQINDFSDNVLKAIPVQAGGLHPISDVWYIEPAINSPDDLRIHIEQLAVEIAHEIGFKECIELNEAGIGFSCKFASDNPVLALLGALSATPPVKGVSGLFLYERLSSVLLGATDGSVARMSDEAIVKLFRIIRLSRRLMDLGNSM